MDYVGGLLDIYDHCFPTNSLKYVVKLLLYPVARGQGWVILCYWVHISLDWAHNEVCGKSCVRWFLERDTAVWFLKFVLFFGASSTTSHLVPLYLRDGRHLGSGLHTQQLTPNGPNRLNIRVKYVSFFFFLLFVNCSFLQLSYSSVYLAHNWQKYYILATKFRRKQM